MNVKLLLVIGLLVLFVPSGYAQNNAQGSGRMNEQCGDRELSAISGVITASVIHVCFHSPEIARTSASVKSIRMISEGPDIPTGGVVTFTASTISASGCTVGSWTTVSETLAAGTGASSYATVTMSSNECQGFVRMIITAGLVPVTLGTFIFDLNIMVEHTSFNDALSGTVTVDDGTGWSVNAAVSGTLNTVVSGSLTTTNTQRCQFTPAVGPNIRFFDFGCWAGILAVPDVITARDESGNYVVRYSLTCISDVVVYSSGCFTNFPAQDITTPFESGASCTHDLFSGTSSISDGSLYRIQEIHGTITFSGSGCTLLLQFTKGSQSGGFIPITVRSDGYLDQSIESIVHQDEACGVSVVCQLEATVHQDEACGATLVCQLEAVVHQDEACGATIVCQTNSTTHIDIGSMNVTESNNTGNESSDKPSVAEQFATWAPLVVALVLIGVCALREKVNYGGMALGALLLAYCAIALPFFDDGIRTLLGFISLYLIVLYAFEEKEYFDEVKRRKREESGEQEE